MNENSVEGNPCINRESKSDKLTIQLYSCHDINMKFLAVVTPPSIHLIGSSPYKQTIKRSIYKTRKTKHPHLPIHHYIQPLGTASLAPLHEILTRSGLIYAISTSMYMSTSSESPPMQQFPRSLYFCIKILPHEHDHWYQNYFADPCLLFYLTQFLRLNFNPIVHIYFDSSCII